MADEAIPKTHADITKDAEGLKLMAANHNGFPGLPALEIACYQAMATYELAAQIAWFREKLGGLIQAEEDKEAAYQERMKSDRNVGDLTSIDTQASKQSDESAHAGTEEIAQVEAVQGEQSAQAAGEKKS